MNRRTAHQVEAEVAAEAGAVVEAAEALAAAVEVDAEATVATTTEKREKTVVKIRSPTPLLNKITTTNRKKTHREMAADRKPEGVVSDHGVATEAADSEAVEEALEAAAVVEVEADGDEAQAGMKATPLHQLKMQDKLPPLLKPQRQPLRNKYVPIFV